RSPWRVGWSSARLREAGASALGATSCEDHPDLRGVDVVSARPDPAGIIRELGIFPKATIAPPRDITEQFFRPIESHLRAPLKRIEFDVRLHVRLAAPFDDLANAFHAIVERFVSDEHVHPFELGRHAGKYAHHVAHVFPFGRVIVGEAPRAAIDARPTLESAAVKSARFEAAVRVEQWHT